MKHEFIDGASSSSTYLIIGRKKTDNMKLAIRRLAGGGEILYRIHVYPSMRQFGLEQPENLSAVRYQAQRAEYETIYMVGDSNVRDYLLPALAARGIEALEFDDAVTQLKAHSPYDNAEEQHKLDPDDMGYDPDAIEAQTGVHAGSAPHDKPTGITGGEAEDEGLGSLGKPADDQTATDANQIDPSEL